MDFLRRNLEVAQEQARNAALTASQSAAGLAQQLSEHTKVLAEQATQLSNAAAEQASQRLKGLQLADGLQSRLQPATEAGPSEAEQLEYAITPHFREFIRSLTYSTFRDFPADNVAVSEQVLAFAFFHTFLDCTLGQSNDCLCHCRKGMAASTSPHGRSTTRCWWSKP